MDTMSKVKRRLITSMISILLLVITIFGITYAYFISQVRGNSSIKSSEVSAGRLELTYVDGNGLIELLKIQPGVTLQSKTFTVTNTGKNRVEDYDVVLENIINELEHYEDLVYTLTCISSSGTCNGSNGNEIFPKEDSDIASNSIDVGVTHTYTLTVTYNETNTDQSNDMNKIVSAKVNIKDENEYKDYKNLIIYGESKQGELPEGYTELDYIEATGTQYINTKIRATNNTGIKVNYRYTASGSAAISGIYKSTSPRQDTLFITSNSGTTDSTLFAAHRGKLAVTKQNIVLNTDYSSSINYMNDGKIYFNDTNITTVGSNAIYDADILLFARFNTSNNSIISSSSRIYSVEFTEGTTISHKFIPCINDNNELGMYDIIGKAFYGNVGTGTFIAGPEIPNPNNPREIKSVGDLVTDINDEHYGKYKISITIDSKTTDIFLDEPLRKVGDYADYIDIKNKKIVRYIYEKQLSEITFTGKSSKSASNSYYASYSYSGKYLKCKPNILLSDSSTYNNSPYVISEILPRINWNYMSSNNNIYGISVTESSTKTANELRISVPTTDATTLNGFKSWLSNHGSTKILLVYLDQYVKEESISLPDIKIYSDSNITINTNIQPSSVNIVD